MDDKKIVFDAVTLDNLFGSFDAEQERIERFKEYFVTNSFYDAISADLPIRIAIGNKGAGKSAVLLASYIEKSQEKDCICVRLSALDLASRVGNLPADGLMAINHWRNAFVTEAASQILSSRYVKDASEDLSSLASNVSDLLSWIMDLVNSKTKGASRFFIKAGIDLAKVKKIVFYIDNLDKGWDGQKERIHFINTLLDACYEIGKREPNIQFKIGIRWDIWDTITRINQDIDKIRQNAIFLRWSTHEIYIVVANRLAKFFGMDFLYQEYLEEKRPQDDISKFFDPILERKFSGLGKWDGAPTRHVILSMTRNRPRDLLSLLTLAADEAYRKKRNKINSTDLQNVFPRYSEERLSDLIVEYKARISGLEEVLLSFKPARSTRKTTESFRYSNDKIATHLKFFVTQNAAKIRFSGEKSAPDFRRILDFLYRIDFLQAWYRRDDGVIERVNFQDRQMIVSGGVDFGYSWEVLPAYRWAIQPTRIDDVIKSLSL